MLTNGYWRSFRGAMLHRCGPLLALLVCGYSDMYAQATKADPVDVQGWTGLGLNHNIGKKWKLEMDVQSRYFNNIQTHSGTYLSAGVQRSARLTTQVPGTADCNDNTAVSAWPVDV